MMCVDLFYHFAYLRHHAAGRVMDLLRSALNMLTEYEQATEDSTSLISVDVVPNFVMLSTSGNHQNVCMFGMFVSPNCVRPDLLSKMDKYFEASYDPRRDVAPFDCAERSSDGGAYQQRQV
jgi:hypothetical protein